MSKMLIVGDMHFRENYPYASSFEDRRKDERKEIEDAIIEASADCESVVIMGDVFDQRNNVSSVVKKATRFLERFGDKQLFIMSGNHESFADGTTALDYLSEISGKKWKVITNDIVTHIDLVFVPYLRYPQLGLNSHEEVVEYIMEKATGGKAIFLHHCLSGTKTSWGQLTDTFHEPVLPSEGLSDRFQRVFGAHIHYAQDNGTQHVLGAVMNHEIGEHEDRRVIKWDTEKDTIESIKLPGRKFYKITNPTHEQVNEFLGTGEKINGVVRVIADQIDETIIEKLREAVDGEVVSIELPPEDRKRVKEDIDDFSLDNLIRIFSEVKEVPIEDLKKGLALIEE
jgi:DNA repair exonuclease SbcCD nuclease subunit